uniref:ShKT domain-containing protein n=1 Tax=Steinernema glaseri TaxID=37863 RepID=A0A1I8AD04_9BILA
MKLLNVFIAVWIISLASAELPNTEAAAIVDETLWAPKAPVQKVEGEVHPEKAEENQHGGLLNTTSADKQKTVDGETGKKQSEASEETTTVGVPSTIMVDNVTGKRTVEPEITEASGEGSGMESTFESSGQEIATSAGSSGQIVEGEQALNEAPEGSGTEISATEDPLTTTASFENSGQEGTTLESSGVETTVEDTKPPLISNSEILIEDQVRSSTKIPNAQNDEVVPTKEVLNEGSGEDTPLRLIEGSGTEVPAENQKSLVEVTTAVNIVSTTLEAAESSVRSEEAGMESGLAENSAQEPSEGVTQSSVTDQSTTTELLTTEPSAMPLEVEKEISTETANTSEQISTQPPEAANAIVPERAETTIIVQSDATQGVSQIEGTAKLRNQISMDVSEKNGLGQPFMMDCSTEVDDRGSELCTEWASGGLCTSHRATMFLFCRKTCLCTGPPSGN